MNQHKPLLTDILLIIGFCSLLFLPFLSWVHLFDWDEINFAECAREMLVSGDWGMVQIAFRPFWEKPPLFIWMQVLSMKGFGISEFAVRFPNAVCGIVTCVVLYVTGAQIHRNRKIGLLWAVTYTASLLPQFYFHSGIIDPWFNLFIFGSVACMIFYLSVENRRSALLLISGLLLGAAFLTKGPACFVIVVFAYLLYLVFRKGNKFLRLKEVLLVSSFALTPAIIWVLFLCLNGKAHVISEFISYQAELFLTQQSGHGGPVYYHVIVLFVGCFPASVYACLKLFKNRHAETHTEQIFQTWMKCLFWTVLVIFSVVNTKILHYSSFCYFPITYFAALRLYDIAYCSKTITKFEFGAYIFFSVLFSLVFVIASFGNIIVPYILTHIHIEDAFARANLEAHVQFYLYLKIIAALYACASALLLVVRHKYKAQVLLLQAISLCAVMVSYTNIVEQYSQRAAIEYFQNLQNKDVYISPLGYKSYAHLFYGNQSSQAYQSKAWLKFRNINPPEQTNFQYSGNAENACYEKFLCTGAIDKPAYFSVKITDVGEIKRQYPSLKELYRKNGFVFMLRETE